MKYIRLTQNKEAIVDDEDYEYLNQWKWYYNKKYAVRQVRTEKGQRLIHLHSIIIKYPKDKVIDHINGNKLDNRKENLRICSRSENIRNRLKHKKSSSKYKGVSWSKANKKWYARIMYNKKAICIGYFENEKDAAKAYNDAALKFHGEFASINKIED